MVSGKIHINRKSNLCCFFPIRETADEGLEGMAGMKSEEGLKCKTKASDLCTVQVVRDGLAEILFFPVLLRCNQHTPLYKFQVYSTMA